MPYIYAVLAVLLWGSSAAVAKLLVQNLSSLQVLFFTSMIATISLFLVALWQNKLNLIKKYTVIDYWRFAWLGFIGQLIYYGCLFAALAISPAQEVSIVNYTWLLWVVVFAAPILGEKLGIRKLFAILLGFAGIYIVLTKGAVFSFHISNPVGALLALGGALSAGLYMVLVKKYNYERVTSTMFYFLFTFILVALATILFSQVPQLSFQELAGLVWLGFFTSAAASVLWALALKHGDTAKMSNIMFLTPFMSLVYIHFLLGEAILLSSVAGLLIIVFGIALQLFELKKK